MVLRRGVRDSPRLHICILGIDARPSAHGVYGIIGRLDSAVVFLGVLGVLILAGGGECWRLVGVGNTRIGENQVCDPDQPPSSPVLARGPCLHQTEGPC